ncbi:MAG: hypothetical protein ACRENE_20030 [Polyangiaceae bacterium]
MAVRETCIACHELSPETETDYTLIGAKFGWRLTRAKAADGSLLLAWRCPSCWNEYKRAQAELDADAIRQSSTPPPASTRRPSKDAAEPANPRQASTSSGYGRPSR